MMSPEQCRAARALLGWTQEELAKAAQVGVVTVRQFEGGVGVPRNATIIVMTGAFEAAGVVFDLNAGCGPGLRFKAGTPSHHPEPAGPATDVMERMDQAIEAHRGKGR